jgi:hypothetical protein
MAPIKSIVILALLIINTIGKYKGQLLDIECIVLGH